jgi:hypothetical protein
VAAAESLQRIMFWEMFVDSTFLQVVSMHYALAIDRSTAAAVAVVAALDIAALVEAWLFDVGSVCRYVKTLAGYTANLQQQQDNQQRGWLPIRPGGIGRCSFMSPLVATSDATSHATHLYAQLSLHRACRDGLVGLKTTLEQQADQAGEQALRQQRHPGSKAHLGSTFFSVATVWPPVEEQCISTLTQ